MRGRYWRYLAALLGAIVLASCGGGDGGGNGGSGGGLSVSMDKSRLDFAGLVGNTIYPQTVNFTLSGTLGGGTYYALARLDRADAVTVTSVRLLNARTATATLAPIAPTAAGQTSGTVTFLLCADPACGNVLWSQAMPYSVSAFSVTPGNLTLAGTQGVALAPQTLTIAPPDTHNLLNATVSSPDTPWLSVQRIDSSTLQLVAASQNLAAGSYQAQVTLATAGGAPLQIPMALTQGNGIVAPIDTALQLQADSPVTATGSLPIRFASNATANWSLRTDQSWLTLSRMSGSGSDTVSYSVDMTAFGALDNDTSATATVTISAPPFNDQTAKVTVTKQLPQVLSMSPNVVAAGTPSTVHITGKYLSKLGNGNGLMAGNIPVSGTVVTSDTTANVDLPSLPVGSYALAAKQTNALTQAPGLRFSAIGTPLPATALIAQPGSKGSIAIDTGRAMIFVPNLDSNSLDRYQWNGSQWLISTLPVAAINNLTFSLDRRTLYVVSGKITLLAIDPDAMTIKASYTFTDSRPYGANLSDSRDGGHGLPITANNRIWFTGQQWTPLTYFDIATSTFVSFPLADFGWDLYSGNPVASADGSRMAIAQPGTSPPFPSLLYSNASDTLAKPAGMPVFVDATLSPDGSLLAANGKLYTLPAMTLSGSIPSTQTTGISFSPFGTRLYVPVYANDFSAITRFEVYDTSHLTSGSAALPLLGTIPVSNQFNSCRLTYWYCGPANIEIDPLGATLVVASDQGLATVAIPTGLQDPH